MGKSSWEKLNREIVACAACCRLREHCAKVAEVKRAAYAGETYWGRPVPNFGPGEAASVKLLIVGLAPGAHGANRTGRVFTGDRSGDFLFRAMWETGWASQAESTHARDGLELIGCAITAVCHCAPPGNKPETGEVENCREFLDRTLELLPGVRGVLALGKIAFDASVKMCARAGWKFAEGKPAFGHGAVAWSDNRGFLMGCYHPSQQNTFTGVLTAGMMREVFARAREMCGGVGGGSGNRRKI
jgi:uracil-DNA glycosylase family 4